VVITSWPFAAFVLAVLILHFALPRSQPALLLVASYLFYALWSWHFPLLLLVLTAGNYAILLRLRAGRARSWLWTGIGWNVLALALLKYAGFYLPEVVRFMGADPAGTTAKVVAVLLPVGFSYRVLENISLLLDVSRGQLAKPPGWLEYALYVAYFPKLLSGPIERGRDFFAQLARNRVVDNEALARAVTLIALGAFRKLVLADTLRALMPPELFAAPLKYSGASLLVWLLADVFVVYNDFAGYTDMVRGVSALFGIDLSRNFFCPFFARNFTELWTRWHMSLSQWLRDYVYMPVSRALLRRSERANTATNLLVPPLAAMVVSALWHQIAWHMLAWGILWGLFLVLGRLPTLWRPIVPPDRQPRWRQVLGMARVWLMLGVSTLLFEMSLPAVRDFVVAVFLGNGPPWNSLLPYPLILVSLAIDGFQYRSGDEVVFRRWPLWARSAALAAVLLSVFLATRFKAAETFIYQFF